MDCFRRRRSTRCTRKPSCSIARKNLDSMLERLLKLPLAAQPGEKWMYSISVDVQGKLIEALSGKPLDEFFAERIFKPLAMKDTAFFVPADKLDRMTVNYGMKDGQLSPVDGSKTSQFATKPALLSGGGGLVSTADDYLRFAQMMLNRGELDGVRILKPETVDLMTRNHLPEKLVPIKLGPLPMANIGFRPGLRRARENERGRTGGLARRVLVGRRGQHAVLHRAAREPGLRRHDAIHARDAPLLSRAPAKKSTRQCRSRPPPSEGCPKSRGDCAMIAPVVAACECARFKPSIVFILGRIVGKPAPIRA